MKYNPKTDTERYYVKDTPKLKEFADDVRYSNRQLEYIRFGLEAGIDVTPYANPDIPADIMRNLYHRLTQSRTFKVRYLNDADEVVTRPIEANTKTSALAIFSRDKDPSRILDIREAISIEDEA